MVTHGGARVVIATSAHRSPLSSAPAPLTATTVALPPGWTRHGPDDDGDFWFQDSFGESHWTIPEEARWGGGAPQQPSVVSQVTLLQAISTGRQSAGLSRFQDDDGPAFFAQQDGGVWTKCEDAGNVWFTNATTGEVSWTLPYGARLLSARAV